MNNNTVIEREGERERERQRERKRRGDIFSGHCVHIDEITGN